MRDQYAGDVSDVLKFAFLRALVRPDRTLGIAWYYAPGNDGYPDGRHLEWRDEPAWRLLDAELHAGLSVLPERSIAALESAAIWPRGTLFHREPMPPRFIRDAWGIRKRAALDGADIIFLDPDNGLGAETDKHATFSEIRLLRQPGRAIAFITFPARNMPHDALVQRLHDQLVAETATDSVVTLRTNVMVPSHEGSGSYVPRQRWFTVVDPDAKLISRVREFANALSSIPRVRVRLDGLTCKDVQRGLYESVKNLSERTIRMGTVKICDSVIWLRHIYNDELLKTEASELPPGNPIALKIDGRAGTWIKMDSGRDGRPTHGFKPFDKATKSYWQQLFQNRQGDLVSIEGL